ncbi:MAG: hypothetical protein IKC64_05245 [Clostridia bacterium]|nr:hypothetical protein [Clostridia bacterium]
MEQIKIHNIVTIKSGEFEFKTHNEIRPFFHHTVSGETPCAYCRIGTSDGFITLKTTIVDYDFNGESDEKFCEYFVAITDDELPAGKKISSVGLLPNATSEDMVNYASLTPVTKQNGVDIEVSIRLNLTVSTTNCAFSPGRNDLVAILLGASTFYGSSIEVAVGNNDHPLVPISRESNQLIVDRSYGGLTVTANEIDFDRTTSAQGDEMVVFINGRSVLRGRSYGFSRLVTTERAVPQNKMITLLDKYLTDISSVVGSSANKLTHFKRRLFAGATTDCEKIIDFTIPSNAIIVSDPSKTYFAVADDAEASVYKFVDGKVTHCYTVEREENEVALAPDGSIFFAGNNLIAHYYDGTTTTRALLRDEKVTQLCVVNGSGCRRIGFLDSRQYYICLYDYDGMIVAEDSYHMGYGAGATALDEQTIMVSSADNGTAIITADSTYNSLASNVTNFVQNSGYYFDQNCYGWLKMFDAMGECYMSHIYDLSRIIHVESGLSYEFISSEIALTYRNGVMESIIFNNLGTISSVSTQNLNLAQPDQVIAVGNYLLLKYGDKLETLYLTSGGWRINLPTATVGDQALIAMEQFSGNEWQPSNEYRLKIKLE